MTTPAAADGFAATATTYDRARRPLIPCFDRFYGTAVDLLATGDRPSARAHPSAEFVLGSFADDLCAPVEPQLEWLRSAGFTEVDAPFRDGRFAVLTGRRPI